MKPKIQLHQVLGIVAIVVVLALTVYIAIQRTNLLSEAGATTEPKFINVMNETSDGFTVGWITTKATQGTVTIIGEKRTFVEPEEKSKTHLIEVTGLKAGQRYEFEILSGTITDNNQGANYEAFTTKYDFAPSNKLLFGRIFGKDSLTPLAEGYVTISAEVNGARTNKVYSKLNEQGGWQLDYSELLNSTITNKFDTTQKALVTLTIYSPDITEAVTRSYDIKLSETLQITDVFLGEDVPWELPAVEDETMEETTEG